MLKLKDGFILRKIAGENVVIPSGNELNLDVMITLNDTGAFLWAQLQNETNEEALVQALLDEYDVDNATASNSVKRFITTLIENEFLA